MITDLGPDDTVDIPDEWGDTVCRYAPTLNTAPVHPWVRVVSRGIGISAAVGGYL